MQFVRLFGIVPLGIGLTVLGFLWLAPFDQFGSPPLFFRLFGSFVALGFILQGWAMVSGAVTDPRRLKKWAGQFDGLMNRQTGSNERAGEPDAAYGYLCSHCGAPLDQSAEVSPHGDVKCSHCGKWFNVHGR
jgi:hypothetical protein